jgi:DNA polymerase III alpha subunit
MICRTEFSFRVAIGRVEQCFDRLPAGGIICDSTAYGHVPWAKEAKKRGVPRGLGARLRVGNADNWAELILVPTTNVGLRDLYSLVGKAARGPIAPTELGAGDWAAFRGPDARGKAPSLPPWVEIPFVPGAGLRGSAAAFSDNRYPAIADQRAWSFSLGAKAWRTAGAAHIQDDWELEAEGASPAALASNKALLERANEVVLPTAQNIKFPVADPQQTLAELTRAELARRGLGSEYVARLERELGLVADKKFADYFLVIADTIAWAKRKMLVGPGRGSSAGSIICWLLRITEIDPLQHKLLFERFIDINRFDLPDIDIDFPDEGRGSVLDYLAEKYGQANVAHIGTVMRYKPKSALTDVAKELKIPPWELDAFKDVIIERSSGDARANDCLRDSIQQFEAGRKLIEKYPDILVACDLEGGARQSGKHAAGMIVCNEPVNNFCAVDESRVAQIDKKMAEALNVLKIDALGLRTLSVLETAATIAGLHRDFFYTVPLDDPATIEAFNRRVWSGIFQFEGNALQSLANQIKFKSFEDIAALTALARPGPLGGGGATRWVEKHEGRMPPSPLHPMLKELTADTYGEILYQEQVMSVCREVGKFSWEDTSAIRKVMSDRRGNEAFGKYEKMFIAGTSENGMKAEEAKELWRAINSMGSWAFNRSHSVAYGLVSYWCGYMKAHYPVAFAAGCLRHAKDDLAAMQQLRELDREGIPWKSIDPEKSREDWEVVDGVLIGGLLGLKGVGNRKAAEILRRRDNDIPLTPGLQKLLTAPSVFENAFPTRKKFGPVYADPKNVRLIDIAGNERPLREPELLREIGQVKAPELVYLLVRLNKKAPRDLNDDRYLSRRLGRRIEGPQTKMLILHLEDDSGKIIGLVDRHSYETIGVPIVEKGVAGESWFAIRGFVNEKRFLQIQGVMWLK